MRVDTSWPLPAAVDHKLAELGAFWERHRSPGGLPMLDSLEVMREVTPLMRFLCLIEVQDRPALIFRVVGGAMHAHTGHELTGKDFLLYTPEDMRATRYAIYRNIVEQPCGMTARHPNANLFGVYGTLYALVLPVVRPGYERPMALGIWVDDGIIAAEQADGAEMTIAPDYTYLDLGFGVPQEAAARIDADAAT